MDLLWSLIALSLCAAFLYGLTASWSRFALLLLHHGGHLSRKDMGGFFITLLLATALPAWFAWQIWRAYGS